MGFTYKLFHRSNLFWSKFIEYSEYYSSFACAIFAVFLFFVDINLNAYILEKPSADIK